MKGKYWSCCLVVLMFLYMCHWGVAQEAEQAPAFFHVLHDSVQPGKIQEYIQFVKEEHEYLASNGFTWPVVTYRSMNDFYYVVGLSSMDEVAQFQQDLADVTEKVGKDKENEFYTKQEGLVLSYDVNLWRVDKEHSYHPNEPVYLPDFTKPFYMFVEHFYPNTGLSAKLEPIHERLIEISQEKNDNLTLYFNELVYGEELPHFMVAIPAASKEAFQDIIKKRWETLGKEYSDLYHQALQLCRKHEVKRLTCVPELSSPPQASEEVSAAPTTSDITKIDLSQFYGISPLVKDAAQACWAPDSRTIAYTDMPGGIDQCGGIMVLKLGETKAQRLTDTGKDPAWSPNGQWIAYVVEDNERPEDGNPSEDYESIWVAKADGSESPQKIATGGFPSWMPDSEHILFHSYTNQSVMMASINSTNPPKKCFEMDSHLPRVSPCGKKIVYSSWSESNPKLIITDLEGNLLLEKGDLAGISCWSDDGKWILGGGGALGKGRGLYVINSDLTIEPILFMPGFWTRPAVSPDGRLLVFDTLRDDDLDLYIASVPDLEGSKGIPKRDSAASSKVIDLSWHYNGCLDNRWYPNQHYHPVLQSCSVDFSELPRGIQTFDGTKFDVRGLIQLNGKMIQEHGGHFPASVHDIAVEETFSKIHVLHACGWSNNEAMNDKKIGAYVLKYADGTQSELDIINGHNTQDWWSIQEEPLKDKNSRVAWVGMNPFLTKAKKLLGDDFNTQLHLIKTTWKNPHPSKEVKSIDFVSKMTDASPFVVAITVE